jgi:hypothetical protein
MGEMGKVVFLGVEGAGKSTLTAALAAYFKKHEERGWSLRPENKAAFAFLERMPKRFESGEFPAQTATFRQFRWSICYKDEPQRELEVLDYPGEIYRLAFLDPTDDPDPEGLRARQKAHESEIRELLGFLKSADQVFVLFNIDDAKNLETDNASIDAVWITMQSIKILSSLENSPELTLLVTQADRLVQAGEDVNDTESLVVKYLPLISQRFKNLKKLLLSARDYENARVGVLPLVVSILRRTALYRGSISRVEKCLDGLRKGDVAFSECEELADAAAACAWFSKQFAELYSEFGGLEQGIKEFREIRGKAKSLYRSSGSCARRIESLQSLKRETHFRLSQRYIDWTISRTKVDADDYRFFWLLLFCGLFFIVILLIVASLGKQ